MQSIELSWGKLDRWQCLPNPALCDLEHKAEKGLQFFPTSKEEDSSMSDQKKKEATAKEEENGQPLDEEELEKIAAGAGPSGVPYYAPDGTILPPG